jgi:hypothetical protein
MSLAKPGVAVCRWRKRGSSKKKESKYIARKGPIVQARVFPHLAIPLAPETERKIAPASASAPRMPQASTRRPFDTLPRKSLNILYANDIYSRTNHIASNCKAKSGMEGYGTVGFPLSSSIERVNPLLQIGMAGKQVLQDVMLR